MSKIKVSVGDAHGSPETICISRTARALCHSFRVLTDYSSLPWIEPKFLRLILRHLDGEDSLDYLLDEQDLIHTFAETWSLAARLQLPSLQNRVIDLYRSIYPKAYQRAHYLYPAPPSEEDFFKAFKMIESECGPGSHAEDFLICLIVQLLDVTDALKRLLSRNGLKRRVARKILAEARPVKRDPITYDVKRFYVSIRNPPPYRAITVINPRGSSSSNRFVAPMLIPSIPEDVSPTGATFDTVRFFIPIIEPLPRRHRTHRESARMYQLPEAIGDSKHIENDLAGLDLGEYPHRVQPPNPLTARTLEMRAPASFAHQTRQERRFSFEHEHSAHSRPIGSGRRHAYCAESSTASHFNAS
ncbi:hypothetical protein BDV96DRAFT_682592 [Lophiotrema nucula]|uniref:Uncharacterized protein n=1 Tax=Lophiotrema nucula TaxID=690887 RepID=A0A6A5ZR52_9PLEO|nr:hypothetical protein BDV96DRAFT_682592 [Lophiotrema nucula]